MVAYRISARELEKASGLAVMPMMDMPQGGRDWIRLSWKNAALDGYECPTLMADGAGFIDSFE